MTEHLNCLQKTPARRSPGAKFSAPRTAGGRSSLPAGAGYLVFLIVVLLSGCAATTSGNQRALGADSRRALADAEARIEKHRKGTVRINPGRFAGQEVGLRVRQISHNFKFGCYLKIDGLNPTQTKLYEDYFKRLFNYAVIGTYWDVTENKRGEQFWTNFDAELAMARRNGWRVQAAPLLWGTNQAGTPKWLPRKPDELRPVLDSQVSRFMTTYGAQMTDVEVVNEVLTPEPDKFARVLGSGYVRDAFITARRTAPPQARLMINDFGVFGTTRQNSLNRDKYFELVQRLINEKTPVDVVGIQAHSNREWISPANIAANLDRYATLGRPLQITEFSAQTKNYDDRTTFERITGEYRDGVWNDELQAEFYREFYTVAFGHPAVEAIVQWGLDDTRAWLPGIGLIGEDLRPKANYRVLDELINKKWRTNLDLTLKDRQFTEFRGFFGLYEIEVIKDGRTLAKVGFELSPDGPNEVTLK